jgi:hypothetical protein
MFNPHVATLVRQRGKQLVRQNNRKLHLDNLVKPIWRVDVNIELVRFLGEGAA